MPSKSTLFLCFLVLPFCTIATMAQNTKKAIPIIGCYTDLKVISEGVVGNGVIKIAFKNGIYVGTFAQLQNELGLASDETPLKNIVVNKSRLTIKFDITFTRYSGSTEGKLSTVRGVTGKISKRGIKMNWRGSSGSYGSSTPFMKRGDKTCY